MKTLYLSDLDGTLLRSETRVSEYTASVINRFVQDGGVFTYATARSYDSMLAVTEGLASRLPVICYNGVFIYDVTTAQVLVMNHFSQDEVSFASELFHAYGIVPIVFAYVNGCERFSYIERRITPAMRPYLDSKISDSRRREVETYEELFFGKIFRYVCMGMGADASFAKMNRILQGNPQFADNLANNNYPKNAIYSDLQLCDVMPLNASKGHAALQLKAMLGCARLVVFGDEVNDLSMFFVADESCAMAGAIPELKGIATAVIDSNDEDGVARWIQRNASHTGE